MMMRGTGWLIAILAMIGAWIIVILVGVWLVGMLVRPANAQLTQQPQETPQQEFDRLVREHWQMLQDMRRNSQRQLEELNRNRPLQCWQTYDDGFVYTYCDR